MRNPFPDAARKASLWGAFFVCAALMAWPRVPFAAECRPPAALREAQVARVVDGDTLRLDDGRSVRLIGVNAPELGREGRPPEPLAEVATRHLAALVAASAGRVGLVSGEQSRDRYGRTLAHAFGRDGRNWEAQQLAAGLGFAVALAPNTALAACQFAAEAAARAAGRGVWQRSPLIEATQLRRGGFVLVRGRVMVIERNSGGLWLQLEGDLVLQVVPQALAQFDTQALWRLQGRVVEARGWLIDRRRRGASGRGRSRWLLPLSHPAMLGY